MIGILHRVEPVQKARLLVGISGAVGSASGTGGAMTGVTSLARDRTLETASATVPTLAGDAVVATRCGSGGSGLVDAGAGGTHGLTAVKASVVATALVVGVRSLGAAAVLVDALGAPVEVAPALVLAAKDAALLLELVDANGRKGGGAVMLGGLVVDFVHGDGGVHNLGLDDFLLDDGLDGLMNVVVDMLALNNGGTALGALGLLHDPLVAELGLLGLQGPLGLLVVTVIELAVDDATDVVLVLLGEDLTVMDRLDLAVVVVLVDLLVDGCNDLLVLLGLDGLVLDCGGDLLVDGCVVVSGLGHEVLDCLLGLVHVELLRDLESGLKV